MSWVDAISTPAAMQIDFSTLIPPAILVVIAVVHFAYFRLHLQRNCQQSVCVSDLAVAPAELLTVVRASCVEFDAVQRTSRPACLGTPHFSIPEPRRRFARVSDSQRLAGGHVNQTVVFREDLEVSGSCIFHKPIKIGGDLIIEGEALFLAPVIVNGTLKVKGTAHFSMGVIAKDDAVIRGTLKVGTNEVAGWAVLRDVRLARKLSLNGTLLADSAVQLKEAA